MNQINLVNNEEEKADIVLFPSFFSFDFIQKERNSTPASQLKDDKLINIENIKNIFEEETLDLNEHVEEDNEKSLYFIKKQDNLDTESRSTENSSNFSLDQDKYSNTKKGDSFKKIINFQTFLKKKRGKKPILNNKKVSKKPHSSDDFDNIQRKIQVHFISFLVSFSNDLIKCYFGEKTKYHFKDVKYDLKRIVNHKYVEEIKQSKWSDIMQMKISPKNKRFNEDNNKYIYLRITQLSNELKDFFDKKYLYIFQKYYLGLKLNQRELEFEGKKVMLSPKTKGFCYLLEKNKFSKIKFVNIIKNVYFADVNYLNDKKFIITNLFN